MRHSRLFIIIILVCFSFGGWVMAQESTDEPTPETTEEATQPAPEATSEPTTAATAEPTSASTPATGGTYTVKAGDTLYRIAVNNGTTVAVLSQLNNISNSSLIYTGQVLNLPSSGNQPTVTATSTPQPSATEDANSDDSISDANNLPSYVVQPGDTLFRIASQQGTTVALLLELNNIANVNLIFAGQRLLLPAGETDTGSDADGDSSSADADFGYGIQVYVNVSNTGAIASQLTQLGSDWVKIDVAWSEIEPLQGEFDYSALDTTIGAIDALGINILLNVYDAPAWSRSNYVLNQVLQLNSGPPEDVATFGAFMTNLATKYNGVVDAYEIWKSPNLLKYWTVPVYSTEPEIQADSGDYPFPSEMRLGAIYYVDLLEAGYNAVNAVDSDALVITSGLAPVGSSDNYNFVATGTYLNNMLKLGAANYSDAIGAIFGASAVPSTSLCCEQPPGVDSHFESFLQYFLEILDFYNDIMQRNDVGDMPLYVTQFGWGTTEGGTLAPPAEGFDWLNYTSQDEQAIYITQAFSEGQALGYVDGMFLYNLNGCSVGDVEACFFSLIDSEGTARPAFGAYQNIEKPAPDA